MEHKSYPADFKMKVVLESLQRDTTLEQVCQRFGVSRSQLHRWRQEFQEKGPSVFLLLGSIGTRVGAPSPTTLMALCLGMRLSQSAW
jgi:transposase-like protein